MRIARCLIVAALAIGALACGDGGDADPVLKFTAIPATNTTELTFKFAPLAAHLSRELGVTVEYVPTADYDASVEAFINGDVHLAWFGGLSGVRARRAVDGARAIAQGRVDPQYRAYFVANPASGLEPGDSFPMGLEGKKFTFGSMGSTSGRLMPEHFIRANAKMSPKEFFGAEMHFSGAHDKTAQLVQDGTFDAGVMDYKTYDRLVAEKKIDPGKCFVLWKTPTFTDYNWTAHPELDRIFGAGTVDRLQTALTALRSQELLAAIDRPAGLIKATNEQWNALELLAEKLDLVR